MKHCTPMKFQRREGRNDSLKLEREGVPEEKEDKEVKRRTSQPPCHSSWPQGSPSQQHAAEANTLEIDRAMSEDNGKLNQQ